MKKKKVKVKCGLLLYAERCVRETPALLRVSALRVHVGGDTEADGENELKWKRWTRFFLLNISIWSRSASCMSNYLSYLKEVTDAGISQQEAGVQKQLSKTNVSCLLLQSVLLVST